MAYGKVRVDQIQSSTRTVDVDNLATTAVATTSVAGLLSATDKTKLDGVATGAEVNVNADWNAGSGDAQILNKPTLGTAAAKNTGTAAGNVVELDGSARLPAVDGSQLTGINTAGTDLTYTASTRLLASSTGTDATLPLFTSTDAGLAPSSGGGTTNFLRADGTFAAPPGGSTDLSYTASTRLLASSTGTDVTLPLFTSTDAGLVPSSGGGTTTFLRADGTFATAGSPPGGSDTQVQFNDAGAFGGDAGLLFNKTTNKLTAGGDVELNDGGTFTTTLQTVTPTAARTISFPNATGTVALVAGSSGQLLYNASGANAGVPSSTVGATGNITLSLNGAASVPPVSVTGTWFAGTTPQVLIQPSNVGTAGAWSASGTGIGVNAVTGFGGNLLDLQMNGTSRFTVSNTGAIIQAGTPSTRGALFSGYIESSAGYYIVSKSGWTSPVDGNVLLSNSVVNNFNLLQLGGTSSSFPAIKRSSAILQARLADDSAYTTIDAQHRLQGTAPASATATGTAGDVRYDASYVYICTATDTWKRAAISTW